MSEVLTPHMIWNGFFIDNNLNVNLLRKYNENGFIYEEVYFNGRKTEEGIVRIFGVICYREDIIKAPAVMIIHSESATVDRTYLEYFANLGYVAFMCDYGGENESNFHTHYPKDIYYANSKLSKERKRKAVLTAKETLWYEWTAAARYSLAFLRQYEKCQKEIAVVGIREGSIVAWQLAAIEKELSAVVTTFSAGWEEYRGKFKFAKENDIVIDDERERWLAGISPQSYALLVKSPMLFLTSALDKIADFDRSFDTMARLNGEMPSFMGVSPNVGNMLTDENCCNLKNWLKIFLNHEEIYIPSQPVVEIGTVDNNLLVSCECENIDEVTEAFLYFAQGEFNPASRYYEEYKMKKTSSGKFAAMVLPYSNSERFYCFVNCKYKNGFTATSQLKSEETSKYIEKEIEMFSESILFNGFKGTTGFTCFCDDDTLSADETFMPNGLVKTEVGTNGVKGITAKYNLATYKLADKRFVGSDGDMLKFDIYSNNKQTIKVILVYKNGLESENKYVAFVECLGGDLWQSVDLSVRSFKDSQNHSLESWSEVDVLFFDYEEPILVNNILWI